MGDEPEDPDPAAFIVVVVLLAILALALLRLGEYCRRKHVAKDDTEHLDPTLAYNDGCCAGMPIFGWCFEAPLKSPKSKPISPLGSPQRQPVVACPPVAPPASATIARPAPVDFSSTKVAIGYLQTQQKAASLTESNGERITRIRLVQNLLQLDKAQTPTESNVGAALVIGVDATPRVFGGYCVNLRERRVDYYVIKRDDFPWPLESPNDSTEFEIKNLLFALSVWHESIKKLKTFRVYTDNNGVNGASEIGMDAQDLLHHLTNCEGAQLVNAGEVYVNRINDLAGFAKFIQPADDLSRWQVDKAVDFICKFYGIHTNRAKGTVKLTRHGTTETKPWYEPSEGYQVKLDAAENFAKNFHCDKCEVAVFDG